MTFNKMKDIEENSTNKNDDSHTHASDDNTYSQPVEKARNQITEQDLQTIQRKRFSEYERDIDLYKSKGTKSGGWFYRSDATLSKQSRWLFKEGGGYKSLVDVTIPQSVIHEINAIKEAYAGELYRLLLGEHVPKTRLVVKDVTGGDKPQFIISSKCILGFHDLADLKYSGGVVEKELDPQTYGKQITKIIIVALLLGETDIKDENMGYAKGKFIKIDHGESLYLNFSGTEFTQPFALTPDFLAEQGKLNKAYFTEQHIEATLIELTEIIESQSVALSEILNKYESILSKYRQTYGHETHRLLGKLDSTIAKQLTSRMEQILTACERSALTP